MKRSGTALGFLLCMLTASLVAMGSARSVARFAAAKKLTTVKHAPEIMPVAYVVMLPEASTTKHADCTYECGQRPSRPETTLAPELPALTKIGDGRNFPIVPFLMSGTSSLITLDWETPFGVDNESGTPEELFPAAPPVLFDLDRSGEPSSSKPIKTPGGVITQEMNESLDVLTLWLRQQAVTAQRVIVAAGCGPCYTVVWAGVEQAQLEREIAELFGDVPRPVAKITALSDRAPLDYSAIKLKLDRKALAGAARALDQLGQSLQGISQRLENLVQTESDDATYPEMSPRSSRATAGETAR